MIPKDIDRHTSRVSPRTWDSDFFGVQVVAITEGSLTDDEATEMLSVLRSSNVRLVYWPANRPIASRVEKEFNGLLVDNKLTFGIDLRASPTYELIDAVSVETIGRPTPGFELKDLEDLAIQSGRYSRFAVDPHFPTERFESLYLTWIHNALNRDPAGAVMAVRNTDRIVGMATVESDGDTGRIGLLAVHHDFRGRHYGEALVIAALRWFTERGLGHGRVVTQGANIAASSLYKKCGFRLEKTEYFYHFWL